MSPTYVGNKYCANENVTKTQELCGVWKNRKEEYKESQDNINMARAQLSASNEIEIESIHCLKIQDITSGHVVIYKMVKQLVILRKIRVYF